MNEGGSMRAERVVENIKQYELGHFKIIVERLEVGGIKSEIFEIPAFSYAEAAAKETMDRLREFENPKADLNFHGSLQCALTVVQWALAIECLMASIVYIYNKYRRVNSLKINDEGNFNQICRAIICAANSDQLQELDCFLKGDLHDFWKIRNLIVHTKIKKYELKNCQNTREKFAIFHHNPFFMTVTDVMEAARIAIQVFDIYRDTISYLDLMPSVPLVGDDAIAFVKLDSWYESVLIPAYYRILEKHGLTTNKKLDLRRFNPIGALQIDCIDCKPVIHAKRIKDGVIMNGEKSKYLQDSVVDEIQRLGVKKGMILLPNQIGRNV